LKSCRADRVRLSPLLFALLLAGCAHLPDLPDMAKVGQRIGLAPAPQPPPPDPKTQMAGLEARLAVLVEQQRLKLDPGARPLVLDPELVRIAREKARDMAAKNYLAHAAPDGQTAASLLMAQDAKFQGLLGENLAAQHYTAQSGVAVDAFARRFLDTWLNSPPHRDNLAFAEYDRTGVGAAVNGDTVYVAQLFATDLGLGPHSDKDPPESVTRFDSPEAARQPTIPTPRPARLRGEEDHLPPR
jgi:uncharacterized protein YkwD